MGGEARGGSRFPDGLSGRGAAFPAGGSGREKGGEGTDAKEGRDEGGNTPCSVRPRPPGHRRGEGEGGGVPEPQGEGPVRGGDPDSRLRERPDVRRRGRVVRASRAWRTLSGFPDEGRGEGPGRGGDSLPQDDACGLSCPAGLPLGRYRGRDEGFRRFRT